MPRFHELPVTAVFTGRAAHTSPQAQVLRSLARALEQEDFTAVSRFATAPACQQLQTRAAADPGSWAKNRAAELQACLPQLRRVVVRGQRATAVFANRQPHTFLQEGGEWKIAE
jgi:Trk K+ transport system NAD-binding subunit